MLGTGIVLADLFRASAEAEELAGDLDTSCEKARARDNGCALAGAKLRIAIASRPDHCHCLDLAYNRRQNMSEE